MNLKKELFLISGISGLILIAVVVFTFWYLFPAMQEASKELTVAGLNLQIANDKQSKQIKDTYEKMQQDYQKVNNFFSDPTTPLGLIGFWEKIRGEENLTMKISPTTIEKYKYDPWGSFGFEITISGHFINIQRFIEKTENSKYLLEINSLVVKKNTVAQKLNEATATIILKAYTN